jgi:hypothetical protein
MAPSSCSLQRVGVERDLDLDGEMELGIDAGADLGRGQARLQAEELLDSGLIVGRDVPDRRAFLPSGSFNYLGLARHPDFASVSSISLVDRSSVGGSAVLYKGRARRFSPAPQLGR